MLSLSVGLGHRHLSEMRIVVCPILTPVFVLWFKAHRRSCPLRSNRGNSTPVLTNSAEAFSIVGPAPPGPEWEFLMENRV